MFDERRQRQRREHAVALDRLFAAVAAEDHARDAIALALEPDDRRVEHGCVCPFCRTAAAMFSNSTLMPCRGYMYFGEVRRRIGLDAERPQNDVLQIQLGDALRLLRRNLRGRQSPDARGIDAEAQVVQRAAEIPDAPLLERVFFLRRRERRLHRRHQVVEDDARTTAAG